MLSCVPPYLIKLACRSSAVVNGAVGLPTSVLMGIPLKGAHDLCFDKTCQGNCLVKRVAIQPLKYSIQRAWPRCCDASQDTSADLICVNIILYVAIRGNLFCRAGHYFLVLLIFLKNLEEEPALQCRRQLARRTRRH